MATRFPPGFPVLNRRAALAFGAFAAGGVLVEGAMPFCGCALAAPDREITLGERSIGGCDGVGAMSSPRCQPQGISEGGALPQSSRCAGTRVDRDGDHAFVTGTARARAGAVASVCDSAAPVRVHSWRSHPGRDRRMFQGRPW